MMALQSYPRCAAYLRGMKVKLDDQSMTNYWGAVILADKWTDKQLQEAGGVDFNDKSGETILGRFEALLGNPRVQKPKSGDLNDSQRTQLLAFLGSRGVMTSRLLTEQDIWKAAKTLWPHIRVWDGLEHLFNQLKCMSKKQRKKANDRIADLPPEWISASKPLPEKAKQ